jgi:hypothetical protein
MVDRISQIYTGNNAPIQKPDKSDKSEKSKAPQRSDSAEEVRPSRGGPIAARLIPNLVDKVEISEAGRAAANQVTPAKEEKLPEETTRAVSDSWYTTGYTQARQEFDAETRTTPEA